MSETMLPITHDTATANLARAQRHMRHLNAMSIACPLIATSLKSTIIYTARELDLQDIIRLGHKLQRDADVEPTTYVYRPQTTARMMTSEVMDDPANSVPHHAFNRRHGAAAFLGRLAGVWFSSIALNCKGTLHIEGHPLNETMPPAMHTRIAAAIHNPRNFYVERTAETYAIGSPEGYDVLFIPYPSNPSS